MALSPSAIAPSETSLVLGTAGHIDHGKTTLVKALTGVDTDRTPQEKARGISIELGFAVLDLDGKRLGVVDVPGHERFIKTMVAGIGGIDLACLVVAADEGVMPQTIEHLDICALMGVSAGVVALTKIDLVDDDWAALVADEIAKALEGHPLQSASIIPVSAKSGRGLGPLRAEIARIAAATNSRSDRGGFRLPVDRVFSQKGFGTVATGTVVSGRLAVGDEVIAIPAGTTQSAPLRVRGLHRHGHEVEHIAAGQRAAINLAGVAVDQIPRGTVLAKPGATIASHILDVTLRLSAHTTRTLSRRTRVLLHHGTAQRNAVVELADRDVLEPGHEALAQLRLARDQPLAAFPGDRFVIRGFTVQAHYGTTLGGGVITRVAAPRLRRGQDHDDRQRLLEAQGDEQVALTIYDRKAAGIDRIDLGARLGASLDVLEPALQRLCQGGDILALGDLYVDAQVIIQGKLTLLEALREANVPINRAELLSQLPRGTHAVVAERVAEELVACGAAQRIDDALTSAKPAAIPERLRQPCQAIAARYLQSGLAPDKLTAVISDLKFDAKIAEEAVKALRSSGELLSAPGGWMFHREPLETLQQQLLHFLQEHEVITTQQWKALTGVTRKHAIPLAEYFDQARVTLRVGDNRKLRKNL